MAAIIDALLTCEWPIRSSTHLPAGRVPPMLPIRWLDVFGSWSIHVRDRPGLRALGEPRSQRALDLLGLRNAHCLFVASHCLTQMRVQLRKVGDLGRRHRENI